MMVDAMKRAFRTHFRSSLFLSLTLLTIGLFPELVFGADKEQGLILPSLDPALRQEAVYEKIRPALLKNGWKPVAATDRDAEGQLESRIGDAGAMYKAGFSEVVGCTATGYCLFQFVKNGKCLSISTVGGYYKGRSPTIYRWDAGCYTPK